MALPMNRALPYRNTIMAQQPQYGLSGSENALRGGLQNSLAAINQGSNQALNTLQQGNQLAQNQLAQGRNILSGDFGVSAGSVDQNTGQPLFNQAAQGVNQFTDAGVQAQNLQSALSGAQGQEAFDQALINNSMQDYLNQRGQQALTNQAAALGGLG